MLHAMLPTAVTPTERAETERYVDTGTVQLYNRLRHMGAAKERIKGKLVGGAEMFEYKTTANAIDIGTANVVQARESLKKLGIPLVREVTGGVVGRTIHFRPSNGEIVIQTTDNKKQVI
jgi:chemotaxis protein CheD